MTISFNLLLALFLLTPGFAVVAGVYFQSQISRVKSPPPAQASVLTLGLISAGALALHLIGATAFGLQDLACSSFSCPLTVEFEPNAYSALSQISEHKALVSAQIVEVLAVLLALSALGFWLSGTGVVLLNSKGALNTPLYGWLADLAFADAPDEVVLAYVLSDVEESGTIVGYEGIVKNLSVTAEREISSILLGSCETFYLRIDNRGVSRRRIARAAPIPEMHLEKSRIRNIAFERVVFSN